MAFINDFRVKNGLVVTTTATVLGTAASTSPLTGALIVTGGVGVGGSGNFNGTVTAPTFIGNLTGTASQVQTRQQTASASYFLTFVDSNNASATGEIVYTTSTVSVNPASGTLSVGSVAIDSTLQDYATITTAATTQVALASFAAASYGCGEFMIQATQGTARHVTKLLVVHNGTTADATEYGVIVTDSSLFSVDVDISGGNVRLLITPVSATSTVFRTSYTLIGA